MRLLGRIKLPACRSDQTWSEAGDKLNKPEAVKAAARQSDICDIVEEWLKKGPPPHFVQKILATVHNFFATRISRDEYR